MSAYDPRRKYAQGSRDGFVLIAVLWILAALAGLIGAYVAYALTMAQSADFYLRRVETDAALSGALELAVYDLTRMDPTRRPPEGVLDYRFGDARAQVRYASETLRLDLNKASLESLTSFLAEKGGGRAFAERYAQRIIAWREKPGGQTAAMEDLSYRAAGATYMPRHGAFQSVEELWDVLQMPADVVKSIMPYVTVYGGREKWREEGSDRAGSALPDPTASARTPLGAPPTQAASAPGSVETAGGPLAPGGAQGQEQILKPTRMEIRVIDVRGRASTVEVVAIGTRDGDAPYNVLLWRGGDDSAGPRDNRRR